MNPIIRRELLETLRTRRAIAFEIVLAAGCALLVLLRWPTEGTADLTGARAVQVLRVFGYGMLAGVVLLVPAFPATALVRERVRGTLALLLTSPLSRWSIYGGKLASVLGLTLVLLTMTLPAAAACHALGGSGSDGGIVTLYAVLVLAAIQLSTLALFVSSRCQSADGALRVTYGLVLAVVVLAPVPYMLVRGGSGPVTEGADWLRCLSPGPAVMELLGQGDVGTFGMVTRHSVVTRHVVLAALSALVLALLTVARLDQRMLDRGRPAGVMTEDRSAGGRFLRRLVFLVDPQRRSGGMSGWVNPVLGKELRSRRFGRSHWVLRLIAGCAILSLALSYVAASGALGWGIEAIGGALVLLQVALLILFTPSLAGGLISSERETGAWRLLLMTPLSPGAILRGKLLSVAWPLLLLLCATLPGYVVLMTINPALIGQVERVVASLVLTAVFSVLLSAAVSSLFRNTAAATTAAYLLLLAVCLGPLLVWLAREAPFGHATVQAVLTVDPVAAALQAAETPGFTDYELLPANWWVIGSACLGLLAFLAVRVRQLSRPE